MESLHQAVDRLRRGLKNGVERAEVPLGVRIGASAEDRLWLDICRAIQNYDMYLQHGLANLRTNADGFMEVQG
jgi:hypothetical protein